MHGTKIAELLGARMKRARPEVDATNGSDDNQLTKRPCLDHDWPPRVDWNNLSMLEILSDRSFTKCGPAVRSQHQQNICCSFAQDLLFTVSKRNLSVDNTARLILSIRDLLQLTDSQTAMLLGKTKTGRVEVMYELQRRGVLWTADDVFMALLQSVASNDASDSNFDREHEQSYVMLEDVMRENDLEFSEKPKPFAAVLRQVYERGLLQECDEEDTMFQIMMMDRDGPDNAGTIMLHDHDPMADYKDPVSRSSPPLQCDGGLLTKDSAQDTAKDTVDTNTADKTYEQLIKELKALFVAYAEHNNQFFSPRVMINAFVEAHKEHFDDIVDLLGKLQCTRPKEKIKLALHSLFRNGTVTLNSKTVSYDHSAQVRSVTMDSTSSATTYKQSIKKLQASFVAYAEHNNRFPTPRAMINAFLEAHQDHCDRIVDLLAARQVTRPKENIKLALHTLFRNGTVTLNSETEDDMPYFVTDEQPAANREVDRSVGMKRLNIEGYLSESVSDTSDTEDDNSSCVKYERCIHDLRESFVVYAQQGNCFPTKGAMIHAFIEDHQTRVDVIIDLLVEQRWTKAEALKRIKLALYHLFRRGDVALHDMSVSDVSKPTCYDNEDSGRYDRLNGGDNPVAVHATSSSDFTMLHSNTAVNREADQSITQLKASFSAFAQSNHHFSSPSAMVNAFIAAHQEQVSHALLHLLVGER